MNIVWTFVVLHNDNINLCEWTIPLNTCRCVHSEHCHGDFGHIKKNFNNLWMISLVRFISSLRQHSQIGEISENSEG